ncbi:MAG: hypothetical protein JXR84_17295 [Anaerolineae bacterium]|nr:hypothetical protein [Anaerolineae bacterium]
MRSKRFIHTLVFSTATLLAALFALVIWSSSTQAGPGPLSSSVSSLTNPLDLGEVGHIGGQNCGIFVQGDYAYTTFGWEFAILDISDPVHPTRVGYTLIGGFAWDVAVSGDYAYVPNYFGLYDFQVIDISDPTAPIVVGSVDTPASSARAVDVAGNYAYTAAEGGGMRVIDISDPAHPVEVSFYDETDFTRDVRVAGNYAYLAGDEDGLKVLDISNPLSPTLEGTCTFIYETPGDYASAVGVAVAGNYAYVTTYYPDFDAPNFRVVDNSDPAHPTEVGSVKVFGGYPGNAEDIFVSAGYAYIAGDAYVGSANWYGGVAVVDVSNPADPTVKANYVTPDVSDTKQVYLSNTQAYLTGYEDGLLVVDVSDPHNPDTTTLFSVPTEPSALAHAGDYLYVGDSTNFLVLDVSDPRDPTIAGALAIDWWFKEIEVAGTYAYAAAYDRGLRVFNVANPANPTPVGFYQTPEDDWLTHVHLSGDYAYATDYYGYLLWVFDVSNPADPALEATYGDHSTPWTILDVYVVGDTAYLAGDGLRVLDVSDPTHPAEAGFCAPVSTAKNIDVRGDYAYAVSDSNLFWVIDVSNPLTPTAVSTTTLSTGHFYYGGLTIEGDYAYIADMYWGMVVVNISDPFHPSVVREVTLPGYTYTVRTDGDLLYLPSADGGVHILGEPALLGSPETLFFMAEAGGPDPTPWTVEIKSTIRSLTWTVSLSPPVGWLDATPISGVTPSSVEIAPNITGLAVDRYTTTLIFQREDDTSKSLHIPVTLIVADEVNKIYLPLVMR